MNFDLSEEQSMLKDSVEKFILQEYDIDKRRALASTESAFSEAHWQTFAQLGWLSVPFEEEVGGFGGSIQDVAVITEEFGKGLVLEPFTESVVLFGGLLRQANEQSESNLCVDLIEKIISGEVRGTAALTDNDVRFDPNYSAVNVETTDTGYKLSGSKIHVSALPQCRYVIVSARTSGAVNDEQGLSLFLLDLEQDAVTQTTYQLMDGHMAGDLTFENLELPSDRLLGEEGKGADLLKLVLPEVILAECAEAVGIMQRLNEMTLEYSKVRKQFGMPIGGFQALQHRMVDTYMAYEQNRSLLYRALISWEERSEDCESDLAALKVYTGRAGKLIAGEAIQIHGGMGITDELSVGHYMKRMRMLNASYGDADYHQSRYNALAIAV